MIGREKIPRLSDNLQFKLPYKDIMRLSGMSYEEKVTEMFLMFPDQHYYFEELYDRVRLDNNKVTIGYSYDTYKYSIWVTVVDLGTYKKTWESNIINDVVSYSHSYTTDTNPGEFVHGLKYNKKDSDRICGIALSFMLSYGSFREDIPLLINYFPEFVNFAMEYIP